jgi:archaellum component FlaC
MKAEDPRNEIEEAIKRYIDKRFSATLGDVQTEQQALRTNDGIQTRQVRNLKERVERLEGRMGDLKTRFEDLEKWLGDLEDLMETLEGQSKKLEGKDFVTDKAVTAKLVKLAERIDELEETANENEPIILRLIRENVRKEIAGATFPFYTKDELRQWIDDKIERLSNGPSFREAYEMAAKNHGRIWTKEDREKLMKAVRVFINLQSRRFGRTPYAIKCQIRERL